MVTAESRAELGRTEAASSAVPELVLCATHEDLASAWESAAGHRSGVRVFRGSVLYVSAHAVVSPANSYGWMRGGIDAIYAEAFPSVEQNVRRAVLNLHGGELPVGEALIVPTGHDRPAWLISAPTMREPGETLPPETVHPYLAARATFRLWCNGTLDDGRPVRDVVRTIALPGLGTGTGGVSPDVCARQVIAAWDEAFAAATTE